MAQRAKKISISKSDEPTLIAEKVITTDADEIVLAVPRFSKLAESHAALRLIKREAEALNKQIVIETVDNKLIELAKGIGLTCLNPFLAPQRHISDIVTSRPDRPLASEPEAHRRRVPLVHHPEPAAQLVSEPSADTPEPVRRLPARRRLFAFVPRFAVSRWVIAGAVVAGIAVTGIVVTTVLREGTYHLVRANTSWSFANTIQVDTTIAKADGTAARVPGQLFTEKKNLQLSFPASGTKFVEQKAGGTITIFNAYSSSPQTLVATTRFAAPDGKIFRLTAPVTVPGAQISDGKIVPSSLSAKVVADKTGQAYNIDPTAKFTIPGFAGTPKFTGFYASSEVAMKGGFSGVAKFATAQDIKKAKEQAAATLESSLRTVVLSQVPAEFTAVDGSSRFKLLASSVEPQANADGQFSASAEGEFSVMGFRESDVVAMLLDRVNSESGGDFVLKGHQLAYGTASFSAANKLSLAVDFKAELTKRIDPERLKQTLAGKAESDLRAAVFSLAGLDKVTISLWPVWARRAPADPGNITVIVD